MENGSEGGVGRGRESGGNQHNSGDNSVTHGYTYSLHPLTCAHRRLLGQVTESPFY